MKKTLENDFLWGVATSSFQIEGGIANDMTDWEKQGKFRVNGKNPLVRGASVGHFRPRPEATAVASKLHS
ncbi:MAG: family 1 glycosylhydrolase [candidate division Zixibacteria bacterium]|nr:family 1 glycosylhydrolase [candidate division Zixibacteria bacterium]